MNSSIQFENLSFAVVVNSPTIRNGLVKVLRECGAKNVQSMDSLTHFYPYAAAHPMDWIFTNLQPDSRDNALGLLTRASQAEYLKSLRISLFLEDSEKEVLDWAFQWGLNSWHSIQSTQDQLRRQLAELLDVAGNVNGYGGTQFAARQLSSYLESRQRFAEMVDVRERLLHEFPDEPENMIGLIRSHFLAGNREKGLSNLSEALALYVPKSGEVKSEFLVTDREIRPLLNVSCCLVVGGEDYSVEQMRSALTEIGIKEFLHAPTGAMCLKSLKLRGDDLLMVLNWSLPDMEGAACLQRIRELGHHATSICIAASPADTVDAMLLSEMDVLKTIRVEKKLDSKQFLKDILSAMQMERFEMSPETLIRRIRQALRMRAFEKADRLKEQLRDVDGLTPSIAAYIEAEIAYVQRRYSDAKKYCLEALTGDAPKHFAIDLLGRTFMRLGKHGDARKCLEMAHSISPKCITRLCALAEVDSAEGNDEAAKVRLNSAALIAPTSTIVQKAQAALAVRSGDIEGAVALAKNSRDPQEIVSMMNNSGVALIRLGQFERGKQCYINAVEVIRSLGGAHSLIPVFYNLALGLVREGKLAEALEALAKIRTCTGHESFQKAVSLENKIKKSILTGAPVTLDNATAEDNSSAKVELPFAFFEERMGALPKIQDVSFEIGGATEPPPLRKMGCQGFFFPKVEPSALTRKLIS